MPDSLIVSEIQDGTAIVRLNRPPANAIDIEFAAELEHAMEEFENRSDVRAIVLTGSGACFSAGHPVQSAGDAALWHR
jgi:enoyl-CoA hydratase/carnithine racemase